METVVSPPLAPAARRPLPWFWVGVVSVILLPSLLVAAVGGYVYWRFFPLISIDEASKKMSLLNGTIEVDGISGDVRVGKSLWNPEEPWEKNAGTLSIGPEKTLLRWDGNQGQVRFEVSPDDKLHWSCRIKGKVPPSGITTSRGNTIFFRLNLQGMSGSECEIHTPRWMGIEARLKHGQILAQSLPQKSSFQIDSGRIGVVEPRSATRAQVSQGKIIFSPAKAKPYRIETEVGTGSVTGTFESHKRAPAAHIQLNVGVGQIVETDAEDALDRFDENF